MDYLERFYNIVESKRYSDVKYSTYIDISVTSHLYGVECITIYTKDGAFIELIHDYRELGKRRSKEREYYFHIKFFIPESNIAMEVVKVEKTEEDYNKIAIMFTSLQEEAERILVEKYF